MKRVILQKSNFLKQGVRAAGSKPIPDRSDSFVFGLFNGEINPKNIFPYPSVFNQEQVDELNELFSASFDAFDGTNEALENDLRGDLDPEMVQMLRDFGLFGMQVPEELGGLGMSNVQMARMSEIGGELDLGVSIYIGAHQSIGFKAILILGTQEMKEKYLPLVASGEKIAAFCLTEPSTGSDASSVQTRAVKQEDGSYLMNGGKIWITGGGIADIFTVFAQVPVQQEDGTIKDKMTAFIVERDFGGVTHGAPEKKMGIKCSNTAEVYFDDVRIPAENMIGEVGEGFKVAMEVLNSGRYGMGATLNGTQKGLIKKATEFAANRTQFRDKIYKFGAIQEKLARMHAEQYASEAVSYLVANAMDHKTENYHLEAACGKIFASERAWHCCDETIQVMGGMGYMFEQGVEKVMRDLRIFRIFEGTNDILRLMVGLQGLQYTGQQLAPIAKAAKSPIANAPTLIKFKMDQRAKEKGSKTAVNDLKQYVDPALHPEAQKVGEAITRFEVASKKILQKFNKDIINQQFHVKRIAEAAIELFASSAVLSRATAAQKHPTANKEEEILLAKTYIFDSLKKIHGALDQLTEQDESHWKNMAELTEKMVNADSPVLGAHPTELIHK
ncbi:Oidioi.mRNA.OKI2018_I69.chr2.g4243.t1.cds [Oikopleura dioica]|uniref:Very long-chain specific acyl-CoA dehydrogenase, mitochondrial n=1 Tax=Oikopleura dioica TaxID=34765 RepID=A0ABN7T5S9_OIKDI|nr:Oidioi.mRNA.OKI2018_I69.chr2.g4243.t1.cds [Oikopleura dioica]